MSDRTLWFRSCVGTLLALFPSSVFSPSADADEIRFDSLGDWQQWQIPTGIVDVGVDGVLRPVAVRKNINAALDASRLGGGVHRVGSNLFEAPAVLDGNAATGWAPDGDADPEDWFVEIYLGSAVSATRVTLQFDEQGPPGFPSLRRSP